MRRNGFAEGPVCALLCNSPPSDLLTNFSCFSQCRKHASVCQFLYVRGKRKKKRRRCMSRVFFSILYYYYCYYFSRPSLTACSTMFAIERKYTSPTKAPWKLCWRDGTIDSHTYIHTVSQGLFDSHGNFFFFSYFVGRSPVMSFIMQKHKPRIFFFEDKEKKRENPRWTYLLDIFSFFEQKKGEKGTWEDTSER